MILGDNWQDFEIISVRDFKAEWLAEQNKKKEVKKSQFEKTGGLWSGKRFKTLKDDQVRHL